MIRNIFNMACLLSASPPPLPNFTHTHNPFCHTKTHRFFWVVEQFESFTLLLNPPPLLLLPAQWSLTHVDWVSEYGVIHIERVRKRGRSHSSHFLTEGNEHILAAWKTKGRHRGGRMAAYCLSADKCTKEQAGHGFINVAGSMFN